MKRLAELYETGDITRDVYEKRKADLLVERDRLEVAPVTASLAIQRQRIQTLVDDWPKMTGDEAVSYGVVQKDFVAVTQIVQSQLLLVANPSLPASNVAEFVALAKSKPGALNYGSTGVGNPLHLTMEMLKSATGIDIQAVPYRGDAPANAALIAGEIQLGVMPMATTLPLIESGRLKALVSD